MPERPLRQLVHGVVAVEHRGVGAEQLAQRLVPERLPDDGDRNGEREQRPGRPEAREAPHDASGAAPARPGSSASSSTTIAIAVTIAGTSVTAWIFVSTAASSTPITTACRRIVGRSSARTSASSQHAR